MKKVHQNETGVRDIPDLLVCTPPKAGTTNWSKVLWQLKYLNELGIKVDKEDRNYINMTNLYSLWFGNYDSENFERPERSWKNPTFLKPSKVPRFSVKENSDQRFRSSRCR